MNANEYVLLSKRTLANLNTKDNDNIHVILGILTEAGELADQFKKHHAYGKPIDWINIEEEIGDIMFYIAGLCSINNLDLEKIMDKNIKKLQQRYPEKFTEENAINRNLDKERKILES
jgi:NTP pyrophosphatase (non-canonical NTP hydrolase)